MRSNEFLPQWEIVQESTHIRQKRQYRGTLRPRLVARPVGWIQTAMKKTGIEGWRQLAAGFQKITRDKKLLGLNARRRPSQDSSPKYGRQPGDNIWHRQGRCHTMSSGYAEDYHLNSIASKQPMVRMSGQTSINLSVNANFDQKCHDNAIWRPCLQPNAHNSAPFNGLIR